MTQRPIPLNKEKGPGKRKEKKLKRFLKTNFA